MQIEAGGNGGPPNIEDNEDIEYLKLFCRSGGLIGGIIFQAPNQRLHFYDDWWYSNNEPMGRKEDQLVSYTWRLFMDDISGADMPEQAKLVFFTNLRSFYIYFIYIFINIFTQLSVAKCFAVILNTKRAGVRR